LKFLLFLGVGGLATAIQYGILILFVELWSITAIIASSVGYVVSSIANYLLNYAYTFKSDEKHTKALSKFVAVAATGLLLNAFIMYVLVTALTVHYVVSQLTSTAVILLWNFVLHKTWTFKSSRR